MDLSSGLGAASRERWTEAGLCRWVGQAVPGDTAAYHHGFLAVDVSDPGLSEVKRRDLLRVASRARSLAAQGVVHLVQRRHGPDDFAYLLVVRPRPAGRRLPPAVALAPPEGSETTMRKQPTAMPQALGVRR